MRASQTKNVSVNGEHGGGTEAMASGQLDADKAADHRVYLQRGLGTSLGNERS
jgi:hypothetical protein